MDFSCNLHTIETDALCLKYFSVPWDTETIGYPVAEIGSISIGSLEPARKDFAEFENWLASQEIGLCNCRVPQENLLEMMFLQERGFRFIELHHEAKLTNLQDFCFGTGSFKIMDATPKDQDSLVRIAGEVFEYGRFHQDLRLGPILGSIRYSAWMQNSFVRESQSVLKCVTNGDIVAFFVVEYPTPKHCHWSLVGMSPNFKGRGLAKEAWRSLLQWHKEEGIEMITTGISSHNTPVINLYVSLGFRFSPSSATYHWMPDKFFLA